ncbi:MAG: hypothetical protein FWG64_14305 [Firmicutes bacterium]|nr:hypothetical protein [Bacillota bacterium]
MLKLDTRKHIECTEKASCLATINKMIKLAQLARQFGVLELENIITENDHFMLKIGIALLVDGASPKQVQEILNNLIVTSFATGEELLNQLIIVQSVLAIQENYNPRVLETHLYAFLNELN